MAEREKIKPWSDADEKKLVVIMLQLLGLPDRAHPAVGSGPSGARERAQLCRLQLR